MIKPQFLQTNHSADIQHILYGVSALDVIFSKHTKEKGMSAFMKSSASQLHGSAAIMMKVNQPLNLSGHLYRFRVTI